MEEKKYLNLKHARTPEQAALMQQILKDGVCPFCISYLKKYHPKPILKETEYWFFTENMSPYQGTKYHFIFIYKPAHVTTLKEIAAPAFIDLLQLVNEAIDQYKMPGGSFFIRFGNTEYTGGSVEHLHAHLLMGDVHDKNHETVKVKLG